MAKHDTHTYRPPGRAGYMNPDAEGAPVDWNGWNLRMHTGPRHRWMWKKDEDDTRPEIPD
ncbi:MAG TPA: hypothetical protein VG984_00880 [Candidatus Paceibacterota bacterium]|nr:hypothetical protein [Candidatus Paceibacterota bacterium]